MTQTYVEDFGTFTANGGGKGPPWLNGLRRAALDRFVTLGFPTPRNEDWHYTNVSPIVSAAFRPIGVADGAPAETDISPFTFGAVCWPRLVFLNGRFSAGLSDLSLLPPGVRVLNLAQAWDREPMILEKNVSRIARFQEMPFTALNTAFMKDGALVHIGPEVVAKDPIHLMFVSDDSAHAGVVHPRNLVVASRHSRATIIESYVSSSQSAYFTNAVTEVEVGEGAALSHYKIQSESKRAFHVGTAEVSQARDSHYVSFSLATGAALSRTNIYTVLDGEGSGATLHGLYMADGEQHVDHQTRIEHAKPNCFSREIYKGILDGSSHGVFNGKVYVQPIAQKTDGKQTNNNLLLSQRARIDTKPQLEIFADDVKCTHGATVGRLDEQALFYMKSRGIASDKARNLLTYAFAAEVLEQIEVEQVRTHLEEMTLKRFTGLEEL